MKDGMKRFTKGCLITALVVFVLGCIICGVCALLGGFKQLRNLNVYNITGIPFFYHRDRDGGFSYGFWDNDHEYWDEEWETHKNWDQVGDADKKQLDLTADTLHNLDIELGAAELYIEESEDDHVWLSASGDTRDFRYHKDGDTLYLVRREDSLFWNWVRDRDKDMTVKVHLYLPKDIYLDDVDIMFGAGVLDAGTLRAHEVQVEVGASVCSIDELVSDDSAEISVGAGQIWVFSLEANEANLNIGAGELYIEGANVTGEADIDIGMGSVEVSGLIAGDLNADCGMGSLTLVLTDGEQDHNYKIECAMGNVSVGRNSYTGLSGEKTINNGSSSTYDIECSMGNVNVSFAQ